MIIRKAILTLDEYGYIDLRVENSRGDTILKESYHTGEHWIVECDLIRRGVLDIVRNKCAECGGRGLYLHHKYCPHCGAEVKRKVLDFEKERGRTEEAPAAKNL